VDLFFELQVANCSAKQPFDERIRDLISKKFRLSLSKSFINGLQESLLFQCIARAGSKAIP